MAKNNNVPSYADEKKKASELGQKRQAKFQEFCAANKKANPKLKGCGITPAQRKVLDGMMTTGQKALYAKEKGNLTERGKAKVKSEIKSEYGKKYGKK